MGRYQDIELKAVNRSGAGEDLATDADKAQAKDLAPLLARIKKILGEEVKDVRASARLADSACCIVMDDSDPTVQMQHLARALGQKDLPEVKPILELNPKAELVRKLQGLEDEELLADASHLLLEQALIQEGAELKNPAEFARRLTRVLTRAV